MAIPHEVSSPLFVGSTTAIWTVQEGVAENTSILSGIIAGGLIAALQIYTHVLLRRAQNNMRHQQANDQSYYDDSGNGKEDSHGKKSPQEAEEEVAWAGWVDF